jgi:hypothetical protein
MFSLYLFETPNMPEALRITISIQFRIIEKSIPCGRFVTFDTFTHFPFSLKWKKVQNIMNASIKSS